MTYIISGAPKIYGNTKFGWWFLMILKYQKRTKKVPQKVISNIGTEILLPQCFGHNSTQKAPPELIPELITTKSFTDKEFDVKT